MCRGAQGRSKPECATKTKQSLADLKQIVALERSCGKPPRQKCSCKTQMGLVNARAIKTTGGPNRISKSPGIKTSTRHPRQKKSPPQKKEKRERKGEMAKATSGPWIFGTLFLKSQTVSFTKLMFSYMSLVEHLPTIKPTKGVVLQPTT